MASSPTAIKKPAKAAPAKASGRGFSISMKGIPRVDAKAKSRMESAARKIDAKTLDYPILTIE